MAVFSVLLLVFGILFCVGFGIAAFVFFILWLVNLTRSNSKRLCPSCSAPVTSDSTFCTRCGAQMPEQATAPKKNTSRFLVLLIVSVVCVFIGVGGTVAGGIMIAQNAGDFATVYTTFAINLNQDSTNHSWDISYDSVGTAHLKKTITVKDGDPASLRGTARLSSGTAQIEVVQGDSKTSQKFSQTLNEGDNNVVIPLDGIKDGSATIVVTINEAKDGNISLNWD